MPEPKTRALIACAVFREEIEAAMASSSHSFCAIYWHEMGLHDHPETLRQTLQGNIDEVGALPGLESIVLAYGLCGNGLLGIRAPDTVSLVLPQAQDCISVFLGGSAPHRELLNRQPETYFFSPGWIRENRVPGPHRDQYLRDFYEQRYPDDDERVDELIEAEKETFAPYRYAAYVDVLGNTEARRYCERCAHFLGWKFQHLPGDPSFLAALLQSDRSDSRLVEIPPGGTIGLSSEGDLLAHRPDGRPPSCS